ncbi:family 43 glycosylhydrolase [Aquibacillus albus]|uniref:GH43 family beta-xylosidase n=1 Tax=Aquibacillus albus TaxID=1168171 RepID=A0ABS2MX63_9BACI|nr:family 43 glycosylhydrolase [Aquibacillus albus]MBM7570378.1 GH43 family beta-xylosidase [Aquibacillus albus]
MTKGIKKILFVVLSLVFILMHLDSSTLLASDPIQIDGNDRPGNEQLPDELKNLKQFKLELDESTYKNKSYHNGTIRLSFHNKQSFDWKSKIGVKYVYVKGGDSGNLYSYKEEETMDKNLHAPKNRGGKQPDIGHVTFYYEEEPLQLFENPIIGEGADPWIVRHSDGYYYYTQTTGNNITIWKSKTITGLKSAESKVVWTPEEGAPNSEHIWAPELHFIDGKWYVYFAASAGDMGKQRMYVLESESSDPFGNYSYPKGTDYGKLTTPSDKWAIDGSILKYNGNYYFAWSGWEGDTNVRQDIYIAPMSNPWTISGDRVELSRPEYDWEKVGFPHVNEGPQFLKNSEGQLFMVYSASGSWTDDYKLGMLTFTGNDPINPDAWEKSAEPVFEKNPEADVYGPGHNGFFKSPDGTEDWIIYHAAKFQGAGWNRNVRIQKFNWNEDGTPNFGTPVSTGTLLEVPSVERAGTLTPGLPVGYKFEAEEAKVNHAKIVTNTSASNGKKVGYIDYEDSYVEFSVDDLPAGDYILKIRYSNGMGQTATHHISVNGASVGEVSYESFGWDSWRFAEKTINLSNGENKIKISKGDLFTEMDFIELVPEQPELRYEAEHASLNKVKAINHPTASNGQKVGYIDNDHSYIDYRINVEESGTYNLNVTYGNGTKIDSSHTVTVNGNKTGMVEYVPTGWDNWGNTSLPIDLEKGINTIKLSKNIGYAEVDYITISK